MYQERLFNRTRWRLASWYAAVMGIILSLCSFTVYMVLVNTYWAALHRELQSVAGTLHDSLEPTLKQAGRLNSNSQQLLPFLYGESQLLRANNIFARFS